MTNLLILGASGQIARHVVEMLGGQADVQQTLFLRSPRKMEADKPVNATLVQGNVLDAGQLGAAMQGQDIVYANLTGDDIDDQAKIVVAAMKAASVQRLIFVLALGIYNEVPGAFGRWNNSMIGRELQVFGRAGEVIEASGLDYTIIRPAWLDDEDKIAYETTGRNEPFKGTVVSRKSVADLIVKIIDNPATHQNESLGVNKPGTDGDKPYFM